MFYLYTNERIAQDVLREKRASAAQRRRWLEIKRLARENQAPRPTQDSQ